MVIIDYVPAAGKIVMSEFTKASPWKQFAKFICFTEGGYSLNLLDWYSARGWLALAGSGMHPSQPPFVANT